jgi:hypothetical protein
MTDPEHDHLLHANRELHRRFRLGRFACFGLLALLFFPTVLSGPFGVKWVSQPPRKRSERRLTQQDVEKTMDDLAAEWWVKEVAKRAESKRKLNEKRPSNKTQAYTRRQKRSRRWVLDFDTSDGEEHVRQLKDIKPGAGAILAFSDSRRRVIYDLDRRPAVATISDVGPIGWIYWVEDKPKSVANLAPGPADPAARVLRHLLPAGP